MDGHFESMLQRLELTDAQKVDAETKIKAVSKLLHEEFYDTDYDGSTHIVIGSYGKLTNIRPPEDVDLLVKIPLEIYEQYLDSPSDLLQRIRKIFKNHYPTVEKISAWGKVVLVQFAEGKHNVELLPGYEIGNTFMIPDTENGGGWPSFDAISEMNEISESDDITNGKTRKLIKIIKRWKKNTSSVNLKSYEIEQYCLRFLEQYLIDDMAWVDITPLFFQWLLGEVDTENSSQVQTALTRAKNAQIFTAAGKPTEACVEWKKIFGKKTFPKYDGALEDIYEMAYNDIAPNEEFIEGLHAFREDDSVQVKIKSSYVEKATKQHHPFGAFFQKQSLFYQDMKLQFEADVQGLSNFTVLWKVRNFGAAAKKAKDLRGKIFESNGIYHEENTRYYGTHYVQCYIIKDNICVARAIQFVPIGNNAG